MRLVALFLCVALLAGCSRGSGSSALPISPDVAPHSENRDFGYRSLYSFEGGRDGANPVAGLTLVSGILYGATPAGGSKTGCASLGCGAAFAVTISGEEHVLHRFVGGTDGATPQAGLLDVNGTLYGTTEYGGSGCTGSSGCGTLFRLSRDGAEHAIHSFGSSGDGFYPERDCSPLAARSMERRPAATERSSSQTRRVTNMCCTSSKATRKTVPIRWELWSQ